MKGVEEYTGLVNEKAILEYVNLKCGTFRLITGQLSTKVLIILMMIDFFLGWISTWNGCVSPKRFKWCRCRIFD